MKWKPLDRLSAAAVVLGVLIVGFGLAVISLSRAGILDFLEHKKQVPTEPTATTAVPPANLAPVPVRTRAPNYQATVREWGPAVVGITVEGSRKIAFDAWTGPELANDLFLRFLRGVPGVPRTRPSSLSAVRDQASS
jgi:serine protease Do